MLRVPHLCRRTRRVAGEDGAGLRRLDGREAAKLFGLDRDLLPEADLVGSAAEEADTVRVQRLVDRGSARLSAGDRDARRGLDGLLADGTLVTVAQVLDDSGLHRELDEIHGHEPDNVLQYMISICTMTKTLTSDLPKPRRYQSIHPR